VDQVHQRPEHERLDVERDPPDVHAGEVQQRVDGFGQPVEVALHDDQALLLLLADRPELPLEDVVGVALDRGERRAQLVAHVGEQVRLQPVQLLQLLVGGAELDVGLLELLDVLLEAAGHVVEGLGEDAQLVLG
jgi:hypothetical protein